MSQCTEESDRQGAATNGASDLATVINRRLSEAQLKKAEEEIKKIRQDVESDRRLTEAQLRKTESEIKKIEQDLKWGRRNWTMIGNSLLAAVGLVSAVAGFGASAYVAWFTGKKQQELEELKARISLITEVAKTGSLDRALPNLQFFVDTSLLPDPGGKIAIAIKNRQIPVLPLPGAHAEPTARVLWVDDHPEYHAGLRSLFELLGMRVSDVLSDRDIEPTFKAGGGFEVVITDLGRRDPDDPTKMDDRAGLKTANLIKQTHPNTPVIIYSKHASDLSKTEYLKSPIIAITSNLKDVEDRVVELAVRPGTKLEVPGPRR